MTITHSTVDLKGLPVFKHITATAITAKIDSLLTRNRRAIDELLANGDDYCWDSLIQPLDDYNDELQKAWSTLSHLHAVVGSSAIRAAYNDCLPKLSAYWSDIGQNNSLFIAYEAIAKHTTFKSLSVAQQKVINNALRDFHLSGVALGDKDKVQYKDIQQQLDKLESTFEEHVLDATQAFKKLITDEKMLSGLPNYTISQAAQAASNDHQHGWLLTLDGPCYLSILQYADSATLRKEIYQAYVTRASEQALNSPQLDNTNTMYTILKLRTEKAKLLGFDSYAHYSLETKMATSPSEVLDFLNNLAELARSKANNEFLELAQFAFETDKVTQLHAWDIAYYSEKLRQEKFQLAQETLRPYFSIGQVLNGLFAITKKLYGIVIKRHEGVEAWHDDVLCFDMIAPTGAIIAHFYLDLYVRQHKRGGAWMDGGITRRKTKTGLQRPVAYINCNFSPPVAAKPALLTHDDVLTLFHEFGHGLHHMLTAVEYAAVSGINGVPWDAVELPSQLMENWAWQKPALDLFARHIDTKETISDDLYNSLVQAKNFQSGMQLVKQLEFALFDFRLHLEFATNPSLDIQALLNAIRKQVAVVEVPIFNRFQHSFTHIFAGGYAAGYYSYKWAEVLSADAFSKFEEQGIFNAKTGKAFLQTILESGGSREPMELFVEFRGRLPNIDALLRHTGIA